MDLPKLNQAQHSAVTHDDGPLLIVAGAGTGKTTVITQRIGWLISEKKAKPDQILALTFTDKSAGEMEERIDRLLPYGYVDLWVSTFHSFAERILHAHAIDIGLPGDFKLLDETSQWMLVRQNLDRFDLDYYRPMGNPTKFIHALLQHFSRLKDENITPEEYLAYAEKLQGGTDNAEFVERGARSEGRGARKKKISSSLVPRPSSLSDDLPRVFEVARAYHTYQQLLLEQSAMDFGDLITSCLRLFTDRPMILKKYREQFKYILVDEFQDTNWAQYQLVKLLAAPKNNLTVVADDDQSIYRFRGAAMSNIVEFENDYPDADAVFLTENYRSRQNILDLAYDFIQHNNPNRLEWRMGNGGRDEGRGARCEEEETRPSSLVPRPEKDIEAAAQKLGMISKKLLAVRTGRGIIEHLHAATLDDEVGLVVEKIKALAQSEKDITWNDFAILVRANASASPFLIALDRVGIPYQFVAAKGLYSQPVILDVLAYLRLLDDYHESAAMYRVLINPIFGLNDYEIVQLNAWANRKSVSLYEALRQGAGITGISHPGYAAMTKLLQLIDKHSASARTEPVTAIVLAFLEDSGYLKELAKHENYTTKEQILALNKFYKKLQRFEAEADDKSVREFLKYLKLERESGDEGAIATSPEEGPEQVKVMTVHASKGLEFRHVFIVNMVDKRFPSTERRDPIEVPSALVKEIVPEGDAHLEEERRLFYVALTRAKDGVYLTSADDYGGASVKKLSRFLHECGFGVLTELAKKSSSVSLWKQQQPKSETAMRVNPPAVFSFTQLKAYDTCPWQYRFAHILKIPSRGKGVFSYGQTMHLSLQRLYQLALDRNIKKAATLFDSPKKDMGDKTLGQLVTEKEALDLFDVAWIDEWYRDAKEKAKYKKQGREAMLKFYAQAKDQPFTTVDVEQGFSMKVSVGSEFYSVRGKIDRIDVVNGKLQIVDYKTGQAKDKLEGEDKEQLLIYQMAAQEIFQKPIESLTFYYLDGGKTQSFLGKPEDLQNYREKMAKIIVSIRTMKFPPKPGRMCAFCDFREICEYRAG